MCVPVQVLRARLDVVVVSLQPFVILGRDPVAEDVHGLRFTLEPDRQLLGDECVRKVLERQGSGDRVVVGDRDEVHPAPLGEFVDLFGRGGAFGQVQAALDAELGKLGGRRVDVQIGASRVVHSQENRPANDRLREEGAVVL